VTSVAAYFKQRPDELAARSRRRDVLLPRQLAMYLGHRYTGASLSEIGAALGRDHSAAANAVRKIERQILECAPLRYQVEALCARLDGMVGERRE
jgi:chromosomal replication initiator protein